MKKKILSMTLAICMVFGSAAALPQGVFSDGTVGITASADWQQEGDFKYDYLQDGTIEIKGYTGKSSTIRVPHAIRNKTVTSIGSYAFNCTKTDSIVIPDKVRFIKECAFKESTVKSISISRTVESIDSSAFLLCPNLTEIKIAAANKNYASSNGALLNKAKTELITCPGGIVNFKVPSGVRTIKQYAFWSCSKLKTINVSDSVTTFEKDAVYYCHALQTINLGKNVTSLGSPVEENPACYFAAECENVANINVASGNKVFSSANGVVYDKSRKTLLSCPVNKANVTIPSNVTTIGYAAFRGNHALMGIYIPNNVKELRPYCFFRCSALKSIVFTNGIKNIPDEAFRDCKSLTSVSIPKGVTDIKDEAFFSCSNLKSVNIPSTVKRIGGNAFKYTALTDLYIPASVKEMSSTGDVFDASVVIYGQKGSKAQEYAKKYGHDFKVVSKPVVRFAGSGRYDTAKTISAEGMASKAKTVVLAYGLSYADALAGVAYAAKLNAPILLTNTDTIPDETLGEIKRLGAKKVIILGGEGAVSSKAEQVLKKSKLTTERIAGTTRFATAAQIAVKLQEQTQKAPEDIFFVYGLNYADALSVSTVAAAKNAPIIYLKKDGELDADTAAYLSSVKGKVKNAYVIGGEGVISNDMMKKAASALGLSKAVRVAGANRYSTCVEINKKFASVLTGKSICAATGLNFPDALAGGVFAAKNKMPLFLADNTLSDEQSGYLKNKKASKLYVFGGSGAVPNKLIQSISKA